MLFDKSIKKSMGMTAEQISFVKGMEKAGRLAAETLKYAESLIRIGVSTKELDQAIHEFTLSRGATSGPLGYHGYPFAICTSVNDVICHGPPNDYRLKDGDIINVDVSPVLDGFFGDTSATFLVGNVSDKARDITDCAKNAMWEGIKAISPGGTTGDIGFAIGKYVTRRGYSAVKEIGGHGIGRKFHDEPFVPSFGKKGKGDRLKPFTCLTVEPMINENDKPYLEFPISNSSIMYYSTVDKTLSAQFEHTVLITDSGYEIMTLL
jgi:methionyl aminopeptidase